MQRIFTICLTCILQLWYPQLTWGQIKGVINDETGSPLPYATVYLENTSTGTVSNEKGHYTLDLPSNGEFTITYQYVGYKKAQFTFEYKGISIIKDMKLSPDDQLVGELVITADREDPAYEIIRKSIKKRNYYKNLVKSLEADLYVKGVVKINDAPKKILGEDIGDLRGILDSTRQGLVYLSESKSKFYFMAPDKTKEIMISTVKSGDNSLFTANQFSWADFDLYDEYLKFGRSIVSPIGDNALSHYNYKLEKTFFDNDGQLINKIKITPKSATSPLLNGYLYITDEYWNIHSTDLQLFGNVLKNTFLDTIHVRQVYIPVGKQENKQLFSQVFTFKAGLLGFKMGGNFTYIFSNFKIDQDVSEYFKDNETFKVEPNALKKDSAFWQSQRPVPLTVEEQKDYIKKDSLQRLWNTKSYMDSVDRKQNKFSILKLFIGYTYENSFKKTSIEFGSILSSLQFNAVEGLKIRLKANWTKRDTLFRKWTIRPVVDYGFADNIIKPTIFAEYHFDNYTLGKISFFAGREYQQFEPRNPINELNNTWNSLWNKINKIRLFQNQFALINYEQEVSNGFYLDVSTSYTERSPLHINTQYSWRKQACLYEENIPLTDLAPPAYKANTFWINSVKMLIRPAQKFSSYPHVKIRDVSNWPNINIHYEMGLPLSSDAKTFHKLIFKLRDSYVNARLLGYFSYNIEAGTFLSSKPTFFGDYFHPLGNELSSPISPELSSFNLMPYYEFSTDKHYMQVNFRHHFNGYISDKIPLLNKTPLKFVTGFSALYQPDKGQYIEPFIGLENFRIGPFQIFDLDYTLAFDKYGFRDHGFTIRLSQLFNGQTN